ncbi:MAG: cobalamin-dependent protein [Deltaproteobacteria bacterium]|nr:cobalamin-dependent protein [Deltaproteobacteria bacterium]
MLEDLSIGFIELRKDEVVETVKTRIERGDDVLKLLEDARLAMVAVGEQFQNGTLFLAEMMLSAEIFKDVMAILKPHLELTIPAEPIGKVVLATPKGDIHDLGKDIFATLLESQGFEVHNLGADVEPSLVVEKVRELKPDFVGFSSLITTAFASMKKTIEIFEKENLRDLFKLMIGGGVTTPMLMDHLGANFQSTDAMEGVDYCLKIVKEKNSQGN